MAPESHAFEGPSSARYERSVRRITLALLVVWSLASFGVTFFARELDFRILGWSFSYWMAAQGSLIVFCVITVVYAVCMNRLDVRHGVIDESPWSRPDSP
jgi:putative solute:sodium symporter small subunit